MIGLEYILNLYGMQHQELAEELGIKKQNINLWIKGKQAVSKKYLPKLSEMFGVEEEYFQKELDDVDKLVIQKEKLWNEVKPSIIDSVHYLSVDEKYVMEEKLIYDSDDYNDMELEIEKTIFLDSIKNTLKTVKCIDELILFKQLNKLFREHNNNRILSCTIDALSHYFNIIPEWAGEGFTGDEFTEEFINLTKRYENQLNTEEIDKKVYNVGMPDMNYDPENDTYR